MPLKYYAHFHYILMLFVLFSCSEPIKSKDDKNKNYSINGKIAKVNNPEGLEAVLVMDGVEIINLKKNNYPSTYTVTKKVTIVGNNSKVKGFAIHTGGVKIQGLEIASIFCSKGVGEGEVEFDSLTVHENILLQGGGPNSAKIQNCVLKGNITLDKPGLSLKVDSKTTMASGKNIIAIQPAQIVGLNLSKKTTVNADIVIDYESTKYEGYKSYINIATNNQMIVGEGIKDGLNLGPNAVIVKLFVLNKESNIHTEEGSKVKNTNNPSVFKGNGEIPTEAISLEITNKEFIALVALTKINASLLGDINADAVDEDFSLATTIGVNSKDYQITWASSDPTILKINGKQAIITKPTYDSLITLTGGVTIDDEITVSRNFILKIIGNYRTTENLDGVLLFDEEIQFDLGSIYHNKTIIFCSIPDKFTIKDCYIDGNKLASANITSEGQANGRKLIKIEKSLEHGYHEISCFVTYEGKTYAARDTFYYYAD